MNLISSKLIIILKIILILLIVAAGLVMITAKPAPAHLVISVQGDFKQGEKVEVFFRTNPLTMFSRGIEKPDDINRLSYPLPKDFTPETIRIDGGVNPITWSVEQVQLSAKYLFFNIEDYEWPISDFAKSLISHPTTVINVENEGKLQITNLTHDSRIYFPFDLDSFESSREFQVLRALLLLACLGLMYLTWMTRYFDNLLLTSNEDAITFRQSFENIWQDKKVWILAGSVLFIAINLLHYFTNLTNPGIHTEDSMELSDILQGHVNLLDAATYEYYRGYKTVIVRWLAYLWNLFPLDWQPALYMYTGFVVASLAMIALSYSGMFLSPAILLIAPTVISLTGLADSVMFLTLTGTLYSSVLLLFAITITPSPKNNLKYILLLLAIPILAWSGPYSPQAIPLSILLLCMLSQGRKHGLLIVTILSVLAYILSAEAGMLQLENITDIDIRIAFYEAIVEHVFFIGLVQNSNYKIGFLVLLIIAGFFYFLRKDRIYTKMAITLLMVSLAALMSYFLSAKYFFYKGDVLPSHTFVSQVFWAAYLLLTVDRLLIHFKASSKLIAGIVAIAILMIPTYYKERHRLDSYIWAVDHKLDGFLRSVDKTRSMQFGENEFVQLWHKTPRGRVMSVLFGSQSPTAKNINHKISDDEIKPYLSPVNFHREPRTLLRYYGHDKIYTSKKEFIDLTAKK